MPPALTPKQPASQPATRPAIPHRGGMAACPAGFPMLDKAGQSRTKQAFFEVFCCTAADIAQNAMSRIRTHGEHLNFPSTRPCEGLGAVSR